MDKQKFIEELECLEIPADSYSYFRGAKYVVERAISLAKQLKESKKAVLPKTATDFIEESLGMGSDKVDIISSADYFSQEIPDDEFSLWFKSNRDLFVDALANGYEVEKEPTYVISVPNCGTHKHYLARFINSNFEMPAFRHIGEEDPLFFKDKTKAAVIADWVKGTVEKWEDNDE